MWDIKEGHSRRPVALPDKEYKFGHTHVSWFEATPGRAVILTEGGSIDDRWLSYTLCRESLAACGVKTATFSFDASEETLDDLTARHPNVDLFATEQPHGITLRMIQVAPELQGQGHATRALQDLTQYADSKGLPIALTPGIPEGRKGLSNTALKGWYKAHGFVPNRGRNKDYKFMQTMIRPRTSAVQKTAAWPDIMAKAKRLVQSGNVTLLRNGTNNVVAHVIGDHGEYQCEISRDDPNSRAITQWTCECPWDQYAFQRTRQWKKYEGRPCAHVLAAYWKSLATPVDDQPTGPAPGAGPAGLPPGGGIATPQGWQKDPSGGGMVYTGPGGPGGMPMAPSIYGPQLTPALQKPPGFENINLGQPSIPSYPIPSGEPHLPFFRDPVNQINPPAIGMGNPMTQSLMEGPLQQGPMFAAPADNSIIPPYPLAEQTLPPPQPVSVPGARPGPYPANPLQQPGTFSHLKTSEWSQEYPEAQYESFYGGKDWKDRSYMRERLPYNLPPGAHVWRGEVRSFDHPSELDSAGIHWTVDPGAVLHGRTDMAAFDNDFDHDTHDPNKRNIVWHGVVDNPEEQTFPRSHNIFNGRSRPMRWEAEVRMRPGAQVRTLGAFVFNHEGQTYNQAPRDDTTFWPVDPEKMGSRWSYVPLENHSLQAQHNPGPHGIDYSRFPEFSSHTAGSTMAGMYRIAKAGDEFPPGSAARLEEATLGQAEGREGATDAGQWMEIPKGKLVEVRYQDPTTGWVEIISHLSGGPMTSYHVKCFVEPDVLTPMPNNRTPFENPKGRFTKWVSSTS